MEQSNNEEITSMETVMEIAAMFPNDDENNNNDKILSLFQRVNWEKVDDEPKKESFKSNLSNRARELLLMKHLHGGTETIHEKMKIGMSLKKQRLRNGGGNSSSSEFSSIYESITEEELEEE